MTVTGSQLVAEAEKLGSVASYVFGGTGPSGYDCSGLVQAALKALGISNVPRTSEEQYAWATPIQANQLAPGDLVFAQFPGDGTSPGHVGIYAGNGKVYSAEDPAAGIGLADLSSWKGSIVGYGRPPGVTVSGATTNAPAPGSGSNPNQSQSQPQAPSAGDLGGLLAPVRNLLHAVATVIDYSFSMFEPGQGFRVLFGAGAAVLAFLSYKVLARPGGAVI